MFRGIFRYITYDDWFVSKLGFEVGFEVIQLTLSCSIPSGKC